MTLLIGFAVSLDTAQAQQPAAAESSDMQHYTIEEDAIEHSDGHGGINYDLPPLYFDPIMFIYTLVLFGAFVVVMKKFVWQQLARELEAREGRIAQAEADAKASRLEVEQLTRQAEARLAEVHQQVGVILAQARADGEAKKAEITAKAEAEARRLRDDALAAIAQARTSALQQLEAATQDQVNLAMEQVAGGRY